MCYDRINPSNLKQHGKIFILNIALIFKVMPAVWHNYFTSIVMFCIYPLLTFRIVVVRFLDHLIKIKDRPHDIGLFRIGYNVIKGFA